MYVIMRHDDYLQMDGSFKREIETVRLFHSGELVARIAVRLKAEVISIEYLLRNKVWTLDKSCKFQFQRALNRATELVESWPLWKQNILDNCGPTVKVAREPIMNLDCDCY